MSRVAEGHFRRKREARLILRGGTSQFRGPSPDRTSSVSSLLGDLAHLRRAWLRCPRHCPGVAVTTLGRPSHRARGGHAHSSWRRVFNARACAFPRRVVVAAVEGHLSESGSVGVTWAFE